MWMLRIKPQQLTEFSLSLWLTAVLRLENGFLCDATLHLCRAFPLLLTRGTVSTARASSLRAESRMYSATHTHNPGWRQVWCT